jgi:aminoglycoside phosphotransferase (APT) family kinase protein
MSEIAELAERFGVAPGEVVESPVQGVANRVWFLGDGLVLRIARDTEPGFADDLRKEVEVIPFARRLGVRTPEMLGEGELDGVPFMVLRRAAGAAVGDPAPASVFRELGAELALLHAGSGRRDVPDVPRDDGGDPREALPGMVEDGCLGEANAEWLHSVFDRLEPYQPAAPERVLIHGDAAPQNLLARGDRLSALLDWGDAGLADPAVDFAKLPMRVVRDALAGYLGAGAGVDAEAVRAWEWRVLWHQLSWAVSALRRGPVPGGGTFWCATPGSRLLEILRYFMESAAPDAWAQPRR